MNTPAVAECRFRIQEAMKEPPTFTAFIYLFNYLALYKRPQVAIQAVGYVLI